MMSLHWSWVNGFVRHVLRQFGRERCLESAGLLTYATLLSLVPLLIVVISVMSSLPGGQTWSGQIQGFMFKYFLPEAQSAVQDTLLSLTQGRAGLTATMGLFLVLTSLILMSNVENALNRIWGVRTARAISSRFVVYWSMLTLGPVLLGASLTLSSLFFSLELLAEARRQSFVSNALEVLSPYFVAALAFFLLFAIVPNRKVPWRHALVGALITAVLFELAKKGFGLYIANFNSYAILYGTLGSIPIFLLWIYMSWVVILFGGSLTAALDGYRHQHGEGWPRNREFFLLFRLVERMWQVQRFGQGLSDIDLMRLEPAADDHQLLRLLENLRLARVIRRDDRGEWILVRDLEELSLAELYASGTYAWPLHRHDYPQCAQDGGPTQALVAHLSQADKQMSRLIEVPLKAFFRDSGPASDGAQSDPAVAVVPVRRHKGADS